jgi:pimeloyl-ACP methyl ester carboxylesterase
VGPSSRLVLLLEKFRAAHPIKTLDVNGDVWEYLVAGAGETTITMLPGAGGTAEVMFEIAAAIEPRFRVVSIGYPSAVFTAEQLIRGIHAILETLGVERTILLGHSLGGIAAQAFAIRHHDLVQGMVLANTGFYLGARAWMLPAVAQAMAHAPAPLLIRFTLGQMTRLTKHVEAHDFWLEYFSEKMAEPEQALRQKRQIACLIDLGRFFRLNPIGRNLDWVESMPVLVITAEDDRGFTRTEKKHLQALYPSSELHAFPRGVGHASFIARAREFSDAVARFAEHAATDRAELGRPLE